MCASHAYTTEGGKVECFWEAEENLGNAGISTWFVVRKIRELELDTRAEAEARAEAKAKAEAEAEAKAKSPWPMRGQNARHTGRVMKP